MQADTYRELNKLAKRGDDVSALLASLPDNDNDTLEQRAERLVDVLRGIESGVAELDAEVKTITERKRKLERTQKQINEHVIDRMKQAGITSVKCAAFTLSLRASDRVVVDDESLIPQFFMRVKEVREPNKVLILDAHRRSELVPGAHVEQSTSLVVK